MSAMQASLGLALKVRVFGTRKWPVVSSWLRLHIKENKSIVGKVYDFSLLLQNRTIQMSGGRKLTLITVLARPARATVAEIIINFVNTISSMLAGG